MSLRKGPPTFPFSFEFCIPTTVHIPHKIRFYRHRNSAGLAHPNGATDGGDPAGLNGKTLRRPPRSQKGSVFYSGVESEELSAEKPAPRRTQQLSRGGSQWRRLPGGLLEAFVEAPSDFPPALLRHSSGTPPALRANLVDPRGVLL